ncbi:MAG: hypothetical protein J1F41_07565 [Lachnospiraceae bacterium]|nr:hypothetical protein [Lachnospiraceae bacterium]
MKLTEKKKPIKTIPKGVWESSRPNGKQNKYQAAVSTESADLQGNGYPVGKQSN